jgi:hypothetical protein
LKVLTAANRLHWIYDPEKIGCKLLTNMVGERGFEPPTLWSRTVKFKTLSALLGVA